jgi:hypothetical protein
MINDVSHVVWLPLDFTFIEDSTEEKIQESLISAIGLSIFLGWFISYTSMIP